MSLSNKDLVQEAKKILADLGNDISTGHLYELFSRLSGQPDHNTAKAKDVKFARVIENRSHPEAVRAFSQNKENVFEVKLKRGSENEIEICKRYIVTAQNEKQAHDIIKEYMSVRSEEITEDQIKFEETRILLQMEEDYEFLDNNWEITYIDTWSSPYISDVYELSEQFDAQYRSFKFDKKMREEQKARIEKANREYLAKKAAEDLSVVKK